MVFSHQVSAVSFYLEQFLSLSVFYNTDIFEEFDLFFKIHRREELRVEKSGIIRF